MSFPPLAWLRQGVDWLAEKPKYQWTLGSNPLLGEKSFATIKLSRGARLLERGYMVYGCAALLLGGPAAMPWFAGATIAQALFNIKATSILVGLASRIALNFVAPVMQAIDQKVNGLDEHREAQKYAKQVKKWKLKQASVQRAAGNSPQLPAQPGALDKLVALGKAFNGPAGAPSAVPQNWVIWDDNPKPPATRLPRDNYTGGVSFDHPSEVVSRPYGWDDKPNPPPPSQTYEEAFRIPSEDQIRIASSGRESVEMHNRHYGNPEPQSHYEPPPFSPPKPDCN